MTRPAATVKLSDDPKDWSIVVTALAERIRSAPKRLTLSEASEVIEVLATLEQVRVWCRRKAGMGEEDA